jgi:RNA polymerase sigma factor (sigma-70 family)
MGMNTIQSSPLSDTQLLTRSRAGDRAAFGRIVERYQSLVCAVAYSACGNLARSEELAQDAFVSAWQGVANLREPEKLPAWLCSIVRNLAASTWRREQRRAHANAALESTGEIVAHEPDPADAIVTQEEATLLWRSLAALPDTYREPMVLYYREGQSVTEVARLLDLAQDAVKQRLSRGRAMLRDELANVVEKTLTRTRPGPAFTIAVLAALPALKPSSAAAATVTKVLAGQAAAAGVKATLAGAVKMVFFGPAIGLLVGLASARAAASTARSPQERTSVHRHARRLILFCFAMSLALVGVLSQVGHAIPASAFWTVSGVFAWIVALVSTVAWMSARMNREIARIRAATGTDAAALGDRAPRLSLSAPFRHESKARFLGLPLVAFASCGTESGSARAHTAIAWFAFGDVALSPLVAMGGIAAAPFAMGGITVGVLSLSWWGAAIGVIAFGTAAVGWFAYGVAALGWRAAAGGVVAAHDYALGLYAHAAEANTANAKAWFATQWFQAPLDLWQYYGSWLAPLVVVLLIAAVWYRGRTPSGP